MPATDNLSNISDKQAEVWMEEWEKKRRVSLLQGNKAVGA